MGPRTTGRTRGGSNSSPQGEPSAVRPRLPWPLPLALAPGELYELGLLKLGAPYTLESLKLGAPLGDGAKPLPRVRASSRMRFDRKLSVVPGGGSLPG